MRSRIAVGLAAGALLATAACTVGPSNPPPLVIAGSPPSPTAHPGTTGPVPLPPLEKPRSAQVQWNDCTQQTRSRLGNLAPSGGQTYQCARVVGPLDPDGQSNQDQGIVRISLLRAGTGPTPLVVVNDLDGLPGTLYAARLAAELPAQFLQTFSLIGLDRRGTGASDGVHCIPQADRDRMAGFDPTATDLTPLLDATTDASQQCILDLDTRTATLDTEDTVSDLDLVRKELGVDRLDAVGHGEGSRVLTVYADRFPGQVGRFVLDGSPDPTLNTTDTVKAQAAGAQATFTAFATACTAAGNCPLGGNPQAALTGLVAKLGATPLTTQDGTTVTPGLALRAVVIGLADRPRWTELEQAIAAAINGDGSGLAAFTSPVYDGTTSDPPRLDSDLVSGCNDVPDRLSPDQVVSAMKDWTGSMPLFGDLYAQSLLLCGPWPVPSKPLPKPTATGTPPIMVISTAADPVTPEAGTQRTAQALAGGVLVNWEGAGHGALGQSVCATTTAQHFLIDGQVPQNSTTCPP